MRLSKLSEKPPLKLARDLQAIQPSATRTSNPDAVRASWLTIVNPR